MHKCVKKVGTDSRDYSQSRLAKQQFTCCRIPLTTGSCFGLMDGNPSCASVFKICRSSLFVAWCSTVLRPVTTYSCSYVHTHTSWRKSIFFNPATRLVKNCLLFLYHKTICRIRTRLPKGHTVKDPYIGGGGEQETRKVACMTEQKAGQGEQK